jgi:hypothetical protein
MDYDYSQGVCYYEAIHRHLVQRNKNNKAFGMGMDLIHQYGLKFFLNKFKRKDVCPDYHDIPSETTGSAGSCPDINDNNQELIFLLSEMIQATGNYHGAKQKNYN